MPVPLLILASRSPRRAKLLADAGYRFEQADPPFDDPPQPDACGLALRDKAVDLARRKAMSLRGRVPDHAVILAADTICVGVDGEPIGQPRDRDDARRMIRSFTDTAHDVVTGVALVGPGPDEPMTFGDIATVRFGPLNDDRIETYLNTDQWRGKAGGYNLFDRQADGWPISVDAGCDPTTVVGLPMKQVRDALATFGIEPDT